ncbi:transcriptional regulator [Burkholderia gladioli]|uniref:transcriptional regulator n=1 Tax=Burkholderia gladioli TaxID=28095 RepID=UPI003132A963
MSHLQHVNEITEKLMTSIGARLREERLRLGLSQDEFASVGGVARRTQAAYEGDERAPDTTYLLAVRELGIDVLFVLTGDRLGDAARAHAQAGEDEDEVELLLQFRQLNDAGKAALQAFLASLGTSSQLSSAPKRAKRLVENRRAALDQRTAENVERAVAEVERARAERAARKKK